MQSECSGKEPAKETENSRITEAGGSPEDMESGGQEEKEPQEEGLAKGATCSPGHREYEEGNISSSGATWKLTNLTRTKWKGRIFSEVGVRNMNVNYFF